jgi:hypothetical protein
MAKRQKPAEPAEKQAFANPERGEHLLSLQGREYRLRPSHSAIVAIEEKTGKSVLGLVRLGNTGDLPLKQIAIVAAELIRAGADEGDSFTRSVNADRIGELIFEHGLPTVTSRLTLCLLDAATGGRTAEGEAKAAPATIDTAGAA